jgi:SNF2 family DNA or RNA helicase
MEVHFRYDGDLYRAIKEINGAKFVPRDSGGPFWTVPLDLTTARRLREAFGDKLVLGNALRIWGREHVNREKALQSLATNNDFPLKDLKIKDKLPELAKWLRPYQRADVHFFSVTSALNLNQQRLGKTAEHIATVFESDLENGAHLVVAPRSTLETVWRYEIERWTANLDKPHEVITYSGSLTTAARERAIEEFWACIDDDWPVWFVCTANTVTDGKEPYADDFEWNSFAIDEYHRHGLLGLSGSKDPKKSTKFGAAVMEVKAKRKYPMSGTPMRGKPINLWPALRFIYPDQFTSKWAWAKNWLEVSNNGFGNDIGSVQYGREDEFYAALAPYAVRRLREEVLPQLPKAQWIDVLCDMTPKQAKQYKQMADNAEAEIEEKQMNALGILSQYTRLKQFADAYANDIVTSLVRCPDCKGEGEIENKESPGDTTLCPKCRGIGKVAKDHIVPSEESGKLPPLIDRLAEQGIAPKGEEQGEEESLAIVASQFSEVCEMVCRHLNGKGIKAELLTGATTDNERQRIQMLFRMDGTRKPGDARVVVMTTTMGVGITLDLVENVHILDETWVPDDQEQLADRAVNTSRMHQIGVYVYRSRNTVEQQIHDANADKASINTAILDLRRQGFRANLIAEQEKAVRHA